MMEHTEINLNIPWHAEMVIRAQAGDAEAFEALAVHYRNAVVAVAFLRTGNRDDAEDIAQEVMTKMQEKMTGLNDPEAFPGFSFFGSRTKWNYRRQRRRG